MSATSAGAGPAAAWGRVPVVLRALILVLAAVLAAEYLDSLFGSVIGTRTAPTAPTSPTATGPRGTAAFVGLLRATGHVVDVETRPLGASSVPSVPSDATLLVIDPRRLTLADRAVVADVASGGGRVVFVGAAPAGLGPLLAPGASVTRSDRASGAVTSSAPGRLAYGVASLTTGVGTLATSGAVRVDVRGTNGPFVASAGRLVWVGSSAPLENANLDQLDNAALALNLAAPVARPVVLDAADMAPPTTASGLRALPSWWFAGIAVIALAGLVWLLSAARRFGPLEPAARALAPARAGHAAAMGSLLAAMPDAHVAEAVAPVAAAARRALLRSVRLAEDTDAATLDADAATEGIPGWVVKAATEPVRSRAEAVEAGRALAWLAAERGTR